MNNSTSLHKDAFAGETRAAPISPQQQVMFYRTNFAVAGRLPADVLADPSVVADSRAVLAVLRVREESTNTRS